MPVHKVTDFLSEISASFKKDDAHSAMYSIITCLVLPIPKPESTMSLTIGRKVSGPTIPKSNTNTLAAIICYGCIRLAMRKTQGMFALSLAF